jgi:hypothetical protein
LVQQDRAKNVIESNVLKGETLPRKPEAPLSFESLSEYACAKLLEKYTGWKGCEGVSFQIPIGRAVFDFRVGDTLVEYHPISLRREFLTDGLRDIMPIVHRLNRRSKLQILEALAQELAAQYDKRRSQTLAAHAPHGECSLICAHTPEEFIKNVVYRFADKRCPNMAQMLHEFRALQREFNKRRDRR